MGKIDYKAIYDKNKHGWYDMTEEPQKYEALLAGHYSDSNHFVYELLQNAEDEKASTVVIEYYKNQLVFYHNGEPFNEADVKGVSSMLMGTKDRDDAQTIGRFGMGFKSVFKYTYQPEIYSDNEAFLITRYLLPVENTESWNYVEEKIKLSCKIDSGKTIYPFENEEHFTKIVIPFLKYGKNRELEAVPGDEVLKKLDELNGEILLFLSHIRSLYWINKENGKYAYITLEQNDTDRGLYTCRITGTQYNNKEEITRYLKFSDKFDHEEMKGAEVSVAYKLNSRADNINEVRKSDIWVYFPTRDNTDLPFLIHGSFETAVSREKLMTPSAFNRDLFEKLCNLIADSMDGLAERKLITQSFLRRIILAAFKDEEKNGTIKGLKDTITKKILNGKLLPTITGEYMNPSEMSLPVPHKIIEFRTKELFGITFEDVKPFVAFNNEKESNFSDYYNWLVNDLKIDLFTLSEWAKRFKVYKGWDFKDKMDKLNELESLYDFCSDNRESLYDTGLSYSRSGPYEVSIRNNIHEAWENLRQAPIILNQEACLVSAYEGKKENVYLSSSSQYQEIVKASIVSSAVTKRFSKMLSEGFLIQEFNNFQYIKEKVIKKYIDIYSSIGFEDDENYTEEYIEDLNQIINLIKQTGKESEIQEMLKEACIIKIMTNDPDDKGTFNLPNLCYVPKSEEGIKLDTFYKPIPAEDYLEDGMTENDIKKLRNTGTEDDWYCFDKDAIDVDYYNANGIDIDELSKLGLITTPVFEGAKRQEGIGDSHWVAIGDFCPKLEIDGLEDNLYFIEQAHTTELAKEKSIEILKLVLSIAGKIKGKCRYRKNNPYEKEEVNEYVLEILQRYDWLYDQNNKLCNITKMSKHDLNKELYGNIVANKEAYEILGFVEKDVDETEDTIQRVANLNKKDKLILLKQLARDLGKKITDSKVDDDWEEEETEQFNPNDWEDSEFPINQVKNIDYLHRHVQEQFYCADPVSYKKVLRQIRVSKDSKTDRAYAIGMYTNSGNVKICQICKNIIQSVEVDQIANWGIEMPQLNLCLCRECSAKYKAVREGNRDEFKNGIKRAIRSLDINSDEDEYGIILNEDITIHFTQTHIAEIKEILRLLDEYGAPSEMPKAIDTIQDNVVISSEEKLDDVVARTGSFISYKKKYSGEDIKDMILEPNKYPLHKAFVGHRSGDVIEFWNNEYELISVIN